MITKAIGCFLFVGYIALSWVLEEFHPFSKYPMYCSFPNYAYAFYVADTQGKMLPLDKYFGVKANEVSHLYVRVCEEKGFENGYGTESNSELEMVGKEMLTRILVSASKAIDCDSVSIHRINWHIENDIIVKDDKQLYKAKVE